MKKKIEIHQDYLEIQDQLLDSIDKFDKEGTKIGNGNRNSIKGFTIENFYVSIKFFKIPHFINKIAYRYFRKSKAERSFAHAKLLQEKGILTPSPIAFVEFFDLIGLQRSFYICTYLNFDLSYSDLVSNTAYPNHKDILIAFTAFTWDLHEKGIFFKDHSSGNTLIIENNGNYDFYLVDLNRMEFKTLNFETRMKNFSRLSPHREMVEVMSQEYARLSNLPFQEVFDRMWFYTDQFQQKFFKKRKLKQKYLGKKY